MYKSVSYIKKVISVLLVLTMLAVCLPLQTSAAGTPGLIFNGAYRTSGNKLTLTVSVDNPSINVGAAMFVLKYDTSLLTVSSSDVTFVGDANKSQVYHNGTSGYIGADWYYMISNSGSSSYELPASTTPTEAVRIVFTLKSGKSFSALKSNSISICTDTAYLDSINGYGADGGVLLCEGLDYYNYNSSTAYASISLKAVSTNIVRLAGTSRVDTSLEIANRGWSATGADTVIITNGYNFADALAGGPLAYALDAPILLTANQASLEASVLSKIKSFGAKNVIILGGTLAVNANIASQLSKNGLSVERIYGNSRFETAVAIANKLYSINSSYADNVFIAYSHNYPDALAVSPIASITGNPILFVNAKGTFDTATANYIKKSKCSTATILGGSLAIAPAAETNLSAMGAKPGRIYGTSRYDTALKICKTYDNVFTSTNLALATGASFPDALAGGAFAAKCGIPIILVNNLKTAAASSDALAYIDGKNAETVYVFGGTGAVSDATVAKYLQIK